MAVEHHRTQIHQVSLRRRLETTGAIPMASRATPVGVASLMINEAIRFIHPAPITRRDVPDSINTSGTVMDSVAVQLEGDHGCKGQPVIMYPAALVDHVLRLQEWPPAGLPRRHSVDCSTMRPTAASGMSSGA
jgi:hypothetical protein